MLEFNLNNLLLIAGTGRNTGKTSFICQICNEWDQEFPLICIKISNHFHPQPGSICHYMDLNFKIYEEIDKTTDKSTSRMLKAGANKVFFIESEQELVYQAFQKTLEFIPKNSVIICESGSLRHFIKPKIFIMMHTIGTIPKNSSEKLLKNADKVYTFEFGKLKIPANTVNYINKKWELLINDNS